MLRQPNLSRFCGVRWNSILANLANDLKSGNSVDSTSISHALSSQHLAPSDIKLLHEILNTNVDNDTANEVLSQGIAHDFSLYFTAAKKGGDLVWKDKALESLIRHNPGRVFSSVKLLEKHANGSTSDAVRLAVVDKLLLGENSEKNEENFVPSDANIVKAIGYLNDVSNLPLSKDLLRTLVKTLAKENALPLLSMLEIDGLYAWLNASFLVSETSSNTFLPLSQLVFKNSPNILSKQTLAKILKLGGDIKKEPYSKDIPLNDEFLSTSEYLESVLKYVEAHKLDSDKKDPEALLLRLQLMETYGIDQDNTDLALRKFHEYQSHEKFGIDLVQAKVVKAFCYQSFKTKNETFLKIAETLVNPKGLAVHTIVQLILCKGRFSSDKSLELYNEYINRVSKDLNGVTKRSPTGILTESLMVACLYDNDREFAHLLYEKAIANGIISDEHEIATIKKVFKVYGESFVEDDWKVAQPIFGEYVLECIKKL